MPQVRVLNLNEHPYKEKFRGEMIHIPAGGEIEMDADTARNFVSRCNGVLRDGDGQPDPRGYKMLKIVPLSNEPAVEAKTFRSMKDGKEFKTQKELDAHLKQFENEVVTDAEAEAAIKARAPQATRTRRTRPGAA